MGQRRPAPAELDLLTRRLQILEAQFRESPEAAARFLETGESCRDESLETVEHAAYAALCTLILNLDEALTKE